MTTEITDIKQEVVNAIEKYHQDNFYNIYPAGKVPEWVYDAVAGYVATLYDEISELRKTKANV